MKRFLEVIFEQITVFLEHGKAPKSIEPDSK
ncbi:hypothetical protein XK24_09740, partial [Streptococcus suis]